MVYVTPLESCNADLMILVLLHIFAFWGLPTKMVSDNGPPFTSDAYKQFCTKYDIQLIYSPHYHPKSNSAERSVQTCKKALQKICNSNESLSITQRPSVIRLAELPSGT